MDKKERKKKNIYKQTMEKYSVVVLKYYFQEKVIVTDKILQSCL